MYYGGNGNSDINNIKYNKIMKWLDKLLGIHRHSWTYLGYTPHGYGKNKELWGTAEARKCTKCDKLEVDWWLLEK